MKTLIDDVLLPCPFCGEATELEVVETSSKHLDALEYYYAVHCPACHCHGPPGAHDDVAAKQWNEMRRGEAALGTQDPV